MAKSGKRAAAKPEPNKAEAAGTDKTRLYIAGAVAAAVLVGGIVYWQSSAGGGSGPGDKKDPDLAELMAPGPLEDISLGKTDAPNTIVEYASMTCPHCAQFHTVVLPELEKKYIDTGPVSYTHLTLPTILLV